VPAGRGGWICGTIAIVCTVVATPLSAGEPAARAAVGHVVAYWADHRSAETAASLLFALSGLLLVPFGAALRGALAGGRRDDAALCAFAGSVLATAGLLGAAGLSFAAADTAGHVDPTVTQAISVLNQDAYFATGGAFALLLAATGVSVIRSAVLPPWFGWASILVAVTVFTPAGFIAFFVMPVWVLGLCAAFGLGRVAQRSPA
jgi:hypothetical protein